MHLIQPAHKQFILLALVAAVVLSLCPIDHLIPMAAATSHDETAVARCLPDLCTTLASKKIVAQDNIMQAKLLFLPVSPSISVQFQNRTDRFTLNRDAAPPPLLKKLYHLHAIYLI